MPIQRPRPDLTELVEDNLGVLSLPDLRGMDVTRGHRRAMVNAGRWRSIHRKGIVTHTGPLSGETAWREALISVGPGARLGGITSLQADGLVGYEEPRIHVWVKRGDEKAVADHVVLHETRRWDHRHGASSGLARSTPPVATVQAALWAVSVRQAMLCMVMPIQQRLARATDVETELGRVKRHRFRKALQAGIRDIVRGAESLNELDFAVECRRRNLPEPDRQVVRELPGGRAVLDVFWKRFRVVVEINGAGHNALDVAMRDEVRITDLQIQGEIVVPLSVLTLRCDPEPIFEALERVFRARGWDG
ncbi:hypothetical protein N802_10335 [Knoellia sinensis KCTC 19936]|uniref:DUF559 domain-containing protein n=1 Tax=Knoellia sinensis KCTC 19936 TaxID=1385520 RepID=A0A0A0IYC0_9MICO|nr:hypothetical protein [Knoellia sinensis]KGN29798.1 hypothetical protein N802_10335 [Knoellia sinensis KCTC 19936]